MLVNNHQIWMTSCYEAGWLAMYGANAMFAYVCILSRFVLRSTNLTTNLTDPIDAHMIEIRPLKPSNTIKRHQTFVIYGCLGFGFDTCRNSLLQEDIGRFDPFGLCTRKRHPGIPRRGGDPNLSALPCVAAPLPGDPPAGMPREDGNYAPVRGSFQFQGAAEPFQDQKSRILRRGESEPKHCLSSDL